MANEPLDPTNPLAQVQALMKGELDTANTRHDSALGALKAASGAPNPEADEAGRWGAIASGFAAPASNFGQALAQAGGAYGKELQRQFQAQGTGKTRVAELEFADAAKRLQGLEGKYATALTAGARSVGTANPWSAPIKIGEGQWVKVHKTTHEQIPLSSNDAALYQRTKEKALEVAVKYGMPDPMTYAEEYAASVIANKPEGLKPPTVFQPAAAAKPPTEMVPTKPFEESGAQATGMSYPKVKQEEQAAYIADQLRINAAEQKRYATNPMVLKDLRGQEVALRQKLGKLEQMNSASTADTVLPVVEGQATPIVTAVKPKLEDNRQQVEEAKGFGGEYGKKQAQKADQLSAMGGASRSLLGDLNLMEKLYSEHPDDIPEGALAPYLDGLKSGLTTLGVELKGTGATDVLKAMSTLQALKSRTADGNNLLPGAMSDFENRLLRSMAPGIEMTREGRMLMIQLMKAQMNMRAELADAAADYMQKHGRLDKGWDSGPAITIAKKNPYMDADRVAAIEFKAKRLAAGVK